MVKERKRKIGRAEAEGAVRTAARRVLEELLVGQICGPGGAELLASFPQPEEASRGPGKTAKLTVGGTGALDVLDGEMLVTILQHLGTLDRLVATKACKSLLALHREPRLWDQLSLTSCRYLTGRVKERDWTPSGLLGLVSALPLEGLRTLELEADYTKGTAKFNAPWQNKGAPPTSWKDWRAFLEGDLKKQGFNGRNNPCSSKPPGLPNKGAALRHLDVRGWPFRTAAMKYLGNKFGKTLESLTYRTDGNTLNDKDGCLSLVEVAECLLKKTKVLTEFELDYFGLLDDGALGAIGDALCEARGGGGARSILERLTLNHDSTLGSTLPIHSVLEVIARRFPELNYAHLGGVRFTGAPGGAPSSTPGLTALRTLRFNLDYAHAATVAALGNLLARSCPALAKLQIRLDTVSCTLKLVEPLVKPLGDLTRLAELTISNVFIRDQPPYLLTPVDDQVLRAALNVKLPESMRKFDLALQHAPTSQTASADLSATDLATLKRAARDVVHLKTRLTFAGYYKKTDGNIKCKYEAIPCGMPPPLPEMSSIMADD